MGPEIIPKARPRIDKDRLEVTWNCPGCGADNLLFTFSENFQALKHEIQGVDRVQCLTCTRKYEVD